MNASRKFIIVSTTIAILLIVLVSISLAYAGRDNTLMADKRLNLQVNGFGLELPLSENGAIYDPICLSSVSDNRIKLENDLGAVVSIDGKTIKAGSTINLSLDSLSENRLITIDVNNEKDHRIIHLRSISSELPKLSPVGESPYEGNYYGTLADGKTGLYEIDTKGELVFFIAESSISPLNETYADFQKHILENGSVRYSYQRISKINKTLGERILLDENHQYLKTFTLKKSEKAKENEALNIPAFILIDDNHYIIGTKQLILAENLPSNLGVEPTGTKIQRVLIQEILDHEVIHEFTSDNFPELYPLNEVSYVDNLDQGIDYTGFNGMILDPKDENLILSFENMNTFIKIDRETQKILWKLSGMNDEFGLSPEQKTIKPTSISLTPQGELIIFDGGQPDESNRILKLQLDEMNKKTIDFQEILLSPRRSLAYGNTQKIGDTLPIYMIAWGEEESGNTAITEIDFNTGKILLEITLPEGSHFNNVTKAIEKLKENE